HFRKQMALKAFQHTAYYDSVISQYLFENTPHDTPFPETFLPALKQEANLRYGENPHQAATLYRDAFPAQPSLVSAKQEQGKPLSYNNLADADAALDAIRYFTEATCVIVKHANPCGIAYADTLKHAYAKAWQTDPNSAFGGIIAFNREVDAALADTIIEQQFVEVLIAPRFNQDALASLSRKPNLRVLSLATWDPSTTCSVGQSWQCKRINGGLLVQSPDSSDDDTSTWEVVTHTPAPAELMADLVFAWKVVRAVKSNAIVFARHGQTLGIGAGQTSRVSSTRIACEKARDANLSLVGSVMASDAFFPFADGIEAAIAAGVQAIIQPGGSVRDQEVIAAANAANIAMVFTGKRHFNH
ncbi:MAG: bifunctional phosphoribosylaminoimidazolecarboxamide formyltransferase/IMP cyclohydrolase, partial [Gammaproteobacteria bacterium]